MTGWQQNSLSTDWSKDKSIKMALYQKSSIMNAQKNVRYWKLYFCVLVRLGGYEKYKYVLALAITSKKISCSKIIKYIWKLYKKLRLPFGVQGVPYSSPTRSVFISYNTGCSLNIVLQRWCSACLVCVHTPTRRENRERPESGIF